MQRTIHFVLFTVVLFACAVAQASPPETLTGKIVSVADGDTLTVLIGNTQHKIRLSGIDCPCSPTAFLPVPARSPRRDPSPFASSDLSIPSRSFS